MRQPPYTTRSGLRIGGCYQPVQRPQHDEDALRLQDALIASRSKHARACGNRRRGLQAPAFIQLRLRLLKLLLQRLLLRAQIGILKLKLRHAAAKVSVFVPKHDEAGQGGKSREHRR